MTQRAISTIAKFQSGRWSSLGSLASRRSSPGVLIINDALLVVGGETDAEMKDQPVELCVLNFLFPHYKFGCQSVMPSLNYELYPAIFAVKDNFCEDSPDDFDYFFE